jgi:endonuclease/exonuclease/phosphatase (EEP) superfamily protein YafD
VSAPSGWRASPAARAVALGGWCVVAALGGVVATRWIAFDANRLFAILGAFTFWLVLLALPVAAAAVVLRRWLLAGAAALLLLWLAVQVVPGLRAEPVAAGARDAPLLRVGTANLRYDNPRAPELAGELFGFGADVLVLQEVTPAWRARLEPLARDVGLRHTVFAARDDAGGQAILSRYPLTDVRRAVASGWPQLGATVVVRAARVRIVDAHVVPPVYLYERHRTQARQLRALVDGSPRPLVVAGDLNATEFNRTVQRLLATDLRSAHAARGRGLATTWPNGRWFPPIRIDHVLVSDEVEVLDVWEGDGAGSDHRPVIADLAILSGDR